MPSPARVSEYGSHGSLQDADRTFFDLRLVNFLVHQIGTERVGDSLAVRPEFRCLCRNHVRRLLHLQFKIHIKIRILPCHLRSQLGRILPPYFFVDVIKFVQRQISLFAGSVRSLQQSSSCSAASDSSTAATITPKNDIRRLQHTKRPLVK